MWLTFGATKTTQDLSELWTKAEGNFIGICDLGNAVSGVVSVMLDIATCACALGAVFNPFSGCSWDLIPTVNLISG